MSKELSAFRKICKNLNSYQFSDEYKENKKLIETALEEKEQQDQIIKIIKETIEFGIVDNKVEENENGDLTLFGRIGISLRKELDEKERQLFRDFILETCFPKELKALEIIKNKRVDVDLLLSSLYVAHYNDFISEEIIGEKQLTQKEFDLLKKVLKDE